MIMKQLNELLPQYHEDYVCEILASMPKGLTKQQFKQRCIIDVRGGYWREVNEALRRYFAKKPKAKP